MYELLEQVTSLREELHLPVLIEPDYSDELNRTLQNSESECPYCGGSNIDTSDDDGAKVLIMLVTCADCGKEWREEYRFVRAWPEEEE
jgi:DNA-directed RNA polymerase subunit RPC12/RpoP